MNRGGIREDRKDKKSIGWKKNSSREKQYDAFREFSMTTAYEALSPTQFHLVQHVKAFTVEAMYQLECVRL